MGVGSNLGDRKRTIKEAREALAQTPRVEFLRSAPLYETEPIGGPLGQEKYINTVWEIRTSSSPRALFQILQGMEIKFGRRRGAEKNAPRTLDLDLLFYGEAIVSESDLVVPHPHLGVRWFVLKPLWDLRADLVHPVFQESVCEMLDGLDENRQKRP